MSSLVDPVTVKPVKERNSSNRAATQCRLHDWTVSVQTTTQKKPQSIKIFCKSWATPAIERSLQHKTIIVKYHQRQDVMESLQYGAHQAGLSNCYVLRCRQTEFTMIKYNVMMSRHFLSLLRLFYFFCLLSFLFFTSIDSKLWIWVCCRDKMCSGETFFFFAETTSEVVWSTLQGVFHVHRWTEFVKSENLKTLQDALMKRHRCV